MDGEMLKCPTLMSHLSQLLVKKDLKYQILFHDCPILIADMKTQAPWKESHNYEALHRDTDLVL